MALAVKTKTPAITAEEMERRRLQVYEAVRSNAMEGAVHRPDVEPIFDAYIAGEIEIHELMPRLKQLRNR